MSIKNTSSEGIKPPELEEESGIILQISYPAQKKSFALHPNLPEPPSIAPGGETNGQVHKLHQPIEDSNKQFKNSFSTAPVEKSCPRCGSTDFDRYRVSDWIKSFFRLTPWRLYHCYSCQSIFLARKSAQQAKPALT